MPGLKDQPGDQPIRVFYGHFEKIFDDIKADLAIKYPASDISQVVLHFKTDDRPAKSPKALSWMIQVQDTFLSFLWAYCYGIMILTPMGGKELTDNERTDARKLLNYAHSLLKYYSEWDKESLPNPELHGKDEKRLIAASNWAFLVALNFIIYHEFAHIILGHVTEGIVTIDRSLEMEEEADSFAVDRLLESDQFDDISYIGALLAPCSLTFFSPEFSGGKDHPDPDDRIRDYLEHLNLDENHFLWGIASYALMEWQIVFKKVYMTPRAFENFKQFFYDILGDIAKLKKL